MAKKFKIDLYDKRHLNNLLKRAKSVEEMFDEAVKEAARAGAASGFNDPDRPFYIDDFPAVKHRIDELVTQLHDKVVYAIEEGDHEEWLLSCEKNDELVEAMTRSIGIPKEQISQWKQPNLEALSAFQARKINGLGLSDRVWSITEQFKQELELALDIGLGEGKSAADLSRDVRRYLNEPERLFRRVRDKHGVLRLSKAAKAYHPGQGVYRSSYKNALRLTATENNIAYRTSDYNRWQQLDFVVGIEIRCSNNHPDYDVCDELKGKYPKDFKFTGWHPFCRCHAVPILKTTEEMAADNERIMKGEPLDGESVNAVKDVPAGFASWIKNNAERIEKAKSQPYFIRDNRGVVDDILEGKKSQKAKLVPRAVKKTKKPAFDIEEVNRRFEIETWEGETIKLDMTTYNSSPISGIDLIELDNEMNDIFAKHGMPKLGRKIVIDADTVTIRYGEEWGSRAYIERVFGMSGKTRYVDHEYFAVDAEYQGKGFSKDVIKAFYKQYRKNGTQKINVHANIDVGGYCWGKYGFYANDKKNVERAIRWRNLNDTEAEKIRDIIEEYYCDKSDNEAFPMIKIASLPYGRKALLNSSWYGYIDLFEDEQRHLFESYLGV